MVGLIFCPFSLVFFCFMNILAIAVYDKLDLSNPLIILDVFLTQQTALKCVKSSYLKKGLDLLCSR